ncbi:uncharacterized protein LACBIDRAFT_331153 [Laccaria bicolor S238N-H82]|uniref:Predicted protein n=1 Tax=Laccaria bicolor (strain S238N-H82 / ATCC MYA-4686) TaxID=486041 RepID=B0DNL4_LACBS|nr:uncharacterized protein LACBIDRAFT_331153 [Laccaria bicolor S238N-H82]EDR03678.1 predicted protein [Laccaria bicolor S238N-H82]|eukprot:XP_001885531.1 predicted protein [Laccaria bicolor S238N-H82]
MGDASPELVGGYSEFASQASLFSTTTTSPALLPFCITHGLILYCSCDVSSRRMISGLNGHSTNGILHPAFRNILSRPELRGSNTPLPTPAMFPPPTQERRRTCLQTILHGLRHTVITGTLTLMPPFMIATRGDSPTVDGLGVIHDEREDVFWSNFGFSEYVNVVYEMETSTGGISMYSIFKIQPTSIAFGYRRVCAAAKTEEGPRWTGPGLRRSPCLRMTPPYVHTLLKPVRRILFPSKH